MFLIYLLTDSWNSGGVEEWSIRFKQKPRKYSVGDVRAEHKKGSVEYSYNKG